MLARVALAIAVVLAHYAHADEEWVQLLPLGRRPDHRYRCGSGTHAVVCACGAVALCALRQRAEVNTVSPPPFALLCAGFVGCPAEVSLRRCPLHP